MNYLTSFYDAQGRALDTVAIEGTGEVALSVPAGCTSVAFTPLVGGEFDGGLSVCATTARDLIERQRGALDELRRAGERLGADLLPSREPTSLRAAYLGACGEVVNALRPLHTLVPAARRDLTGSEIAEVTSALTAALMTVLLAEVEYDLMPADELDLPLAEFGVADWGSAPEEACSLFTSLPRGRNQATPALGDFLADASAVLGALGRELGDLIAVFDAVVED